jgi:hypothetical protein
MLLKKFPTLSRTLRIKFLAGSRTALTAHSTITPQETTTPAGT